MAIDWLDALEGKVKEAAERLAGLKEENRALARRVEELEAQLHEASRAEAEAGDWQAERDEVRRRVERLAEGLEELARG